MAIAEMSKLNLVAMSYDRDKILNALHRTNATEVKLQYETENTVALTADGEALRAYLHAVESALACLCAETEAYQKDYKIKSDALKDGFTVSYAQFMTAKEKRAEADALVDEIEVLDKRKKDLRAQLTKLQRTIGAAELYAAVNEPLNAFHDTPHAKIRLGTLPLAVKEEFFKAMETEPLTACTVIGADADNLLVLAAAHNSCAAFDKILQNFSFAVCPFDEPLSGKAFYADLKAQEGEILAALDKNRADTYARHTHIPFLKTYSDRIAFELEKAELSEKMRATQTTFLLEAYVPKEAENTVKEALDSVSGALYYQFSAPAEDEMPPTLYQNNGVVKNFETITNMYSPVSYREFDPNAVMSLFYSIFLGFIMGDMGYGLLMMLGGGLIYYRQRGRDSGLKRLAGVFAVGGVFALVWGILFNSLFGLPLPFLSAVIPDAQKDMWSFLGIRIPAVLILSLEIGVIQLTVGYLCRAWQCWRKGRIADGILDGVVWAVFSIGVGLAIVGLIDEANMPTLAYVGGIAAAAALLLAILTAGRKEKAFGKFTKGFGAAYSVINFASDVLSYARLYGLMLSGAVIAQIVSQYSVDFITGGKIAFVLLGGVLMLVGHIFNLAIGLLGAYIHDARLQYVEFYGRFYEGEGELFSPLGSTHKYVSVAMQTDVK